MSRHSDAMRLIKVDYWLMKELVCEARYYCLSDLLEACELSKLSEKRETDVTVCHVPHITNKVIILSGKTRQ